jgi:hypothetical protein
MAAMAPRSPLVVASAWLALCAGCPDSQAVAPGDLDAAPGDPDAAASAVDAAPARVCDPRGFGAAGDGARKDTRPSRRRSMPAPPPAALAWPAACS